MIKATVVRTRQRAAQLSIELSCNPDDLALAVQAASGNQGGDQARTANGRLWARLPRAERDFTLAEGQQETLTRLAVVLSLGVRVLAVL